MAEDTPDPRAPHADAQDIIGEATEEARIAAVCANAAHPAPRVTRRRVVAIALVVALSLLAVLLAANVLGVSPIDLFTPAPTSAVARRQAQEAVDAMVAGIEGYREDYTTLPESLAQIAPTEPGTWTYSRTAAGGYRVVLERHGHTVTYDSAHHPAVIHAPRP